MSGLRPQRLCYPRYDPKSKKDLFFLIEYPKPARACRLLSDKADPPPLNLMFIDYLSIILISVCMIRPPLVADEESSKLHASGVVLTIPVGAPKQLPPYF